jgi:hypothetical protein
MDNDDGAPIVSVSASWLIEHDAWDQACQIHGLNERAVNEGRMSGGDLLTFTLEQARDLGLLRAR